MSVARSTIATIVFAVLGLGISLDLAASKPLNPFRSPPLLALGSGQVAGGAHCTAVPAE